MGDENALMAAINQGPVSIAIEADKLLTRERSTGKLRIRGAKRGVRRVTFDSSADRTSVVWLIRQCTQQVPKWWGHLLRRDHLRDHLLHHLLVVGLIMKCPRANPMRKPSR